MKVATLGMVVNERGMLLLGEKKRGEIGTGVLAGPGGKLEPGETLEECLMRETREEFEIELDPRSLERRARLDCYAAGELDFRVHVFFARIRSGEPHETDDMWHPNWYPLWTPPYERMFEADRHWMPAFIREPFVANVHYRSRAKEFDRIEFLPFE